MRNFFTTLLLIVLVISYAGSVRYVEGEAYVRLKPGYALSDIRAYISNAPEALMPYKISFTKSYFESDNNSFQFINYEPVKIIKAEEPLLRTYRVKFSSGLSPEKFCKYLKSLAEVELAEPIVKEKIMAYVPNDTEIGKQGHLEIIGAFDAWETMQGDTSVVICISDNGVDNAHVDLAPNIAANFGEIPNNNIDDDGNGYVDDFNGYNFAYQKDGSLPSATYISDSHGTEVAGISSAATNNAKGVAGIGFKCRFYPLKAASDEDAETVSYGYESIIYAAVRGFKVLNLSWGSQYSYSEINKSIIEYAVARDVAIVASSGYVPGSGLSALSIEPYYPAGYYGVLGVTEVNNDGIVLGSTAVGSHARIAAPAPAYTTKNNSTYGFSSFGSSFSSPMVAGAVGLVRAKYPELKAQQALELVRKASVDVSENNSGWEDFLPRMLNLAELAAKNPIDEPGIVIKKVNILDTEGYPVTRMKPGNEYIIKVEASNELGEGSNIGFKLKNIWDFNESVTILEDSVFITKVDRNSPFTIGDFKIKLNKRDLSRILFKLEIKNETYTDAEHFSIVPTTDITTFQNDAIMFSVSDNGRIGYDTDEDDKKGVGFLLKEETNGLYRAGLLASSGNTTLSAIFGANASGNDFTPVKTFEEPNRNIGIVADSNGAKKLNIEMKQEFYIPPGNKKYTRVFLTLKNTGTQNLAAPAIGYYFDWDVEPDINNNIAELLPEAIPAGLKGQNSAAQGMYTAENIYAFGTAITSSVPGVVAQSAVFTWDDMPLTEYALTQALSNGTSLQNPGFDDYSYVIGMRYTTPLAPSQEYVCTLCIAGGLGKEDLTASLKECLSFTETEDKGNEVFELNAYPNPAKESITITGNSKTINTKIRILNILGQEVLPALENKNAGNFTISAGIEFLSSGIYFININDGTNSLTKEFRIVK